MINEQQLVIFKSLEKIRALCIKHLAIGQSVIPYDILTVVYLSEISGEPINLKELFLRLPFSDMGIRYHLKNLVEQDWIEIIEAHDDKRRRLIKPKKS